MVNSFHHQAVKEAGDKFRVVGHTPEGKNIFACDGTFAPMEIVEQ